MTTLHAPVPFDADSLTTRPVFTAIIRESGKKRGTAAAYTPEKLDQFVSEIMDEISARQAARNCFQNVTVHYTPKRQ